MQSLSQPISQPRLQFTTRPPRINTLTRSTNPTPEYTIHHLTNDLQPVPPRSASRSKTKAKNNTQSEQSMVPIPLPPCHNVMTSTDSMLLQLSFDIASAQQRNIIRIQQEKDEEYCEQKLQKIKSQQSQHSQQQHSMQPSNNKNNNDPRRMMDAAERSQFKKGLKDELFGPSSNDNNKNITSTSSSQNNELIETQLHTKSEIANEMEKMSSQLRGQVDSIKKTLGEEKHVLDSISNNMDFTSLTLQDVNKRLGLIVGGAWWDLFTNFAMMITVGIVFGITMTIIFTIPKAKWF